MSAQKTLYVREDSVPLWEEAERISGMSASALVEMLLREYVNAASRESTTEQGDYIVVTVAQSEDDDAPVVRKRFRGAWIIDGFKSESERVYSGTIFDVAVTEKGRIVVLTRYRHDEHYDYMTIYEGFENLKLSDEPEDLISAIALELGEDYVVDLDI